MSMLAEHITSGWRSLPVWTLPPVPWMLFCDSYPEFFGNQIGVKGNQASAPAARGAILRAWLQRCSSARNAASQQYACWYPRTTVSLSQALLWWGRILSCVWESSSEQMHATVPATNASWPVIYLKLTLLHAVRMSVLSQHVSRQNGCLIHHQASQFSSVQLDLTQLWKIVSSGKFRVNGEESKWQLHIMQCWNGNSSA